MNIQKSRLAAVLTMAFVFCMMASMFTLPASAAEIGETLVSGFENGNSRVYYIYGAIMESFGAEKPENSTWARIASYFVDTEWFIYFYANEDTGEVFIDKYTAEGCIYEFKQKFPNVRPPVLPESYVVTEAGVLYSISYSDWVNSPYLNDMNYVTIIEKYPPDLIPEETEPPVPEETEPPVEPSTPEETEPTQPSTPEESEPPEPSDPVNPTTPAVPPSDDAVDGGAFGTVTISMLSRVMDEIKGLLPVVIPAMLGYIGLRKSIAFLMEMLRRA